jgi:hypothetical protein
MVIMDEGKFYLSTKEIEFDPFVLDLEPIPKIDKNIAHWFLITRIIE